MLSTPANLDTSRAQIISFFDTHGEVTLSSVTITNQKGPVNAAPSLALTAPSPYSSDIPLFSFSTSVSMQKFKTSMLTVSDVVYIENPVPNDASMIFSIQSPSSGKYVASAITIQQSTFTNFHCYSCTISPIFLVSKTTLIQQTAFSLVNSVVPVA